VRLVVRWAALAAVVTVVLNVLPWPRGPMVPTALSPHVLIGSAIAARSVGLATLVGLPVLLVVLVRRRWFCRHACPVGLLAEYAGRVRSARKTRLKRVPLVGRWIVLVTLGGACFGYPLFLWLDPMAVFHGAFTLVHDPLSLAGRVSAALLAVILGISLLWPGAWCLRICPLGATQELLVLWQRLFRRKASATTPGAPTPLLSRRSLLSTAVGAACLGVGARLGLGAWGGGAKPLRPPGAVGQWQFSGLCIRCGNCLRACPTGIIEPASLEQGVAGFLAPVVRFLDGYCREDCHRCTQVCPSGAIEQLSLEKKQSTRMGVARLDFSICLLSDDGECDICARACPYEAIDISWSEEEYLAIPRVDEEKCPGCGACQVLCPGTNEWERSQSAEPIAERKAIEVRAWSGS